MPFINLFECLWWTSEILSTFFITASTLFSHYTSCVQIALQWPPHRAPPPIPRSELYKGHSPCWSVCATCCLKSWAILKRRLDFIPAPKNIHATSVKCSKENSICQDNGVVNNISYLKAFASMSRDQFDKTHNFTLADSGSKATCVHDNAWKEKERGEGGNFFVKLVLVHNILK